MLALPRNKRESRRRSRARWATFAASVVSSSVLLPQANMVFADSTGFSPYASVGVTYDDNLFRLSENADTVAVIGTDERADTYRVIEAGADLSAQVSRQRFSLHGDVMQTRFSRFDSLDNNGGSARARWDWSVLSSADGKLGYDYHRALSSFETQSAGRNIRNDQRAYAEGDLRIAQRARVRLGASERKVDNSLEAQRVFDARATTVESALHLLSEPAQEAEAEPNYLGLWLRATRGDYPNPQSIDGTLVDNSFDERELGLVAGWRFANLSQAQAFIGRTEREHDQLPARDFAGPTARVDCDWQVSGKTAVVVALWRELTVADDQSASYVLSEGLLFGPEWAMTHKVTLKARVGVESRDYRGDPNLALGLSDRREDRIASYGLALEYEPAPAVRLGLAWRGANRESNQELSDYRYRSVTGTLRAHF